MEAIKKILIPVDFSNYSKSALVYAKNFCTIFNPEYYFIYVIEPIVFPADFSMGQIAFPVVDNQEGIRAKSELESFVKLVFTDCSKINFIIKNGKPFIEIIETARELDIDLIITATHGQTGVEHLLFGSTAEKIVRKAPCPVLSLRDPLKGFKF
jgi:nucleotide-binding universal stress UspA family protein